MLDRMIYSAESSRISWGVHLSVEPQLTLEVDYFDTHLLVAGDSCAILSSVTVIMILLSCATIFTFVFTSLAAPCARHTFENESPHRVGIRTYPYASTARLVARIPFDGGPYTKYQIRIGDPWV